MPWEQLSKWLLGVLAALVGWLGANLVNRVRELEKGRVTRADFDELRSSMMATFTQGHQALEAKLDRIIERLMR